MPKLLRDMNPYKSAGPDFIPTSIIKVAAEDVSPILYKLTYCAKMTGELEDVTDRTNHLEFFKYLQVFLLCTHDGHRHQRHGRCNILEEDGCLISSVRSTLQFLITPDLEVIKLEVILKLKIKRNDWLLANTCL